MIILSVLLLAGVGLIKGQELATCPSQERVIPVGLSEPAESTGPALDCDPPNINAAARNSNGDIIIFKGPYYWKVSGNLVLPGYPRQITQDFDEDAPTDVDTALVWPDGRLFLFKDDQYFSYTDGMLDFPYPRNISDGFCGIPPNLDAAVIYPGNKKVYFFKGDLYWRFDLTQPCKPISSKYPEKIAVGWKGMPNSPDAVIQGFQNPNEVYFIKDGSYFVFSSTTNDKNSGRSFAATTKFGPACNDLTCLVPSP